MQCGVAKPQSSLRPLVPPNYTICKLYEEWHLWPARGTVQIWSSYMSACLQGHTGSASFKKIPVGLFCPAQTWFFPSQRQFMGGGFRRGMPWQFLLGVVTLQLHSWKLHRFKLFPYMQLESGLSANPSLCPEGFPRGAGWGWWDSGFNTTQEWVHIRIPKWLEVWRTPLYMPLHGPHFQRAL